ncbi:urease accessory protein UreD [Leptolyngbya sp. FACHB-261]|uniref:urease accessory protein UreD n=1 Tax=Leptolyngbya sp. FACHB-261 TaxID=2692806 RepID=UPI00168427BD|nr:urease accessory protein UreD [Leptolyngbya sp. FACHB-261]MBD2101208.1 urease accessory protein UreD [Leptolyngbya sp. FACHB-261]
MLKNLGRSELVACDRAGRTVVTHQYSQAPLQLSAPLYLEPHRPTLYLRNPNGGLLGGDVHQLSVVLEAGAQLELRTQSATRLHPGSSEQHQQIRLEDGASLTYCPHPLIPGQGAHYCQTTHIDLAPTACLFYSEVWASGRVAMGECWQFQGLESRLRIYRDGCPILWETQCLGPDLSLVQSLPSLGEAQAWGTLCCFGPWSKALPDLPKSSGLQTWSLDNDAGDRLVRCIGASAQQIWQLFQSLEIPVRSPSLSLRQKLI